MRWPVNGLDPLRSDREALNSPALRLKLLRPVGQRKPKFCCCCRRAGHDSDLAAAQALLRVGASNLQHLGRQIGGQFSGKKALQAVAFLPRTAKAGPLRRARKHLFQVFEWEGWHTPTC